MVTVVPVMRNPHTVCMAIVCSELLMLVSTAVLMAMARRHFVVRFDFAILMGLVFWAQRVEKKLAVCSSSLESEHLGLGIGLKGPMKFILIFERKRINNKKKKKMQN